MTQFDKSGIRPFFMALALLAIATPALAASNAVDSIRKVAEQLGDPSAQYILGNMYARGNRVDRDPAQAIYWYRLAAEQGHTGAEAKLGILLLEGPKKLQQHQQARSFLERAAKKNHPDAQHHLGEMFRRGIGVKADMKQAGEWYKKAAAQHHPVSQYRLGRIFETGSAGTQDLVKARKWYESAQELGSQAARKALLNMAEAPRTPRSRAPSTGGMTQLEQNLAWAKAGDTSAMYRLARLYAQSKETRQSVYWYNEAANKGHTAAQYELAQLYLKGDGVQKDEDEALIWLTMASSGGHKQATRQLARLEPEHLGTKATPTAPKANRQPKSRTTRAKPARSHTAQLHDKAMEGDTQAQYELAMQLLADKNKRKESLSWLERAVSADHALAKYQLASMLLSGRHLPADPDRGMLLMEEAARQGVAAANTAVTTLKSAGYDQHRAAEKGDPEAQFALAQNYLASSRRDDHQLAIKWLTESAQNGYSPAMIHLGHLYMRGEYTDQNQQQAFKWYLRAAEAGEAEAQFQIAQMYSRGTGTSRSNALAARWYRMAARQNHLRAQEKLGGCLVCD